MPILESTRPSHEATRRRKAAMLLFAGSLLNPLPLHAQELAAQNAFTLLPVELHQSTSASALPAAPETATESRTRQALAADVDGQGSGARPFPTFRQRERRFLLDFAGPSVFLAPAFEAGIDTARSLKIGYPSDGLAAPGNHPAHGDVPEWGEGAQGYAKRYADRFGQGLVGTTSRYALGEVLREDVTYHRCQCTGLVPRTAHAFLGAYTAHTRSGRTLPSLPAAASPFIASEIAVSAWYPDRYNVSDALRISVLNYVAAPFKNLFAEFIAR